MNQKEQKRRTKKFENRVYAFIAGALLISFLIAVGSMLFVIFRTAAEEEKKKANQEQKPYEVQHAYLPVTLEGLGFTGVGEESTESVEASGSRAAMIYQYSDIFYQKDGSYNDYCLYGVYVCDNESWAEQYMKKQEDTQALSKEECGVWNADSGTLVTQGEEKGRLYLRYGDHLLYWQSGYELSEEQIHLFLDTLKAYMENRPELA